MVNIVLSFSVSAQQPLSTVRERFEAGMEVGRKASQWDHPNMMSLSGQYFSAVREVAKIDI